jgi:hypothetical protein
MASRSGTCAVSEAWHARNWPGWPVSALDTLARLEREREARCRTQTLARLAVAPGERPTTMIAATPDHSVRCAVLGVGLAGGCSARSREACSESPGVELAARRFDHDWRTGSDEGSTPVY